MKKLTHSHSVEIIEIYLHTFLTKIREINIIKGRQILKGKLDQNIWQQYWALLRWDRGKLIYQKSWQINWISFALLKKFV